MPTFLTTDRMPPALKARVERSVSRSSRAKHNAAQAALGPVFKGPSKGRAGWLVPVLALMLVGGLMASMQLHERRTLEGQRDAVLSSLAVHRLAWSRSDDARMAAIDRWVVEVAKEPYPGDSVAPELLTPGEIDVWLARPAVYLRGSTPDLREASRHPDAAARSLKDAFLLCLVEPPRSRSEADVLAKIRGVNFGGSRVEDDTSNVRRLHEARMALAPLSPAFEAAVHKAESVTVLQKLGGELETSPIQPARDAASAELLIVVADEAAAPTAPPGPSGAPSPTPDILDQPHDARVALIDLTADKVLLRARRRVDVSGRSRNAKALHGAAMQGCELALDARLSLEE